MLSTTASKNITDRWGLVFSPIQQAIGQEEMTWSCVRLRLDIRKNFFHLKGGQVMKQAAQVIESPSLIVFKNCKYVVFGDMGETWTWQ